MYPLRRNRILRRSAGIRDLVKETTVTPDDFLVPMFIVEGAGVKEEIPSMPGYFRYSLDLAIRKAKDLHAKGLKGLLLFVKVEDGLKDNKGTEAVNTDGLMQRAVKEIKNAVPEMVVMTDVALDPYSSYGHDGIVSERSILNDETCEVLAEMAVTHARAGADFVAPSDMMDGRILRIREALESDGFSETGIMAYSAKYASAFYGPFRDALDSAPGFGDKKTYQMNPANRMEAIKEAVMDAGEGADILMVKPGLCYLDIVREIKGSVDLPVSVYQVSGEYAMVKAAAERGWLDHDAVMLEQLTAIKRAGADLIASYFAEEFVDLKFQ